MAVAALLASFFLFCVEGIVIATAAIIICLKLREKYLVKIPVIISVLAVIVGAAFLIFFISHSREGVPATSYWFIRLLFSK